MDDLAAKVIERIEDNSPGLGDFDQDREDRFLIHFTDGTALEVTASGGYDGEGYPDYELLDAAAIAERRAARKEFEEVQEQKRREREAWLALACSERARRLDRNKYAPRGSLIPDAFSDVLLDSIAPPSKDRCPRCRERECPNAPEHIPAPAMKTVAGTIMIPKTMLS
jgi:hypothetical protein